MHANSPEIAAAPAAAGGIARPDPAAAASREDAAACAALLRQGSRTFDAAARLLPRALREPATVLYAFCRLADDAVDVDGTPGAVDALRARLTALYAGQPRAEPVDRAFAAVVRRHAIPRRLPEALLEGLAWDAAGRQYESLDDLYAYAARVAGSVGVMLTLLTGVRSAVVLARAADLGVAMQLTNIARDVGEDARAGRLYLPRQWMRAAGIHPDDWLQQPRHDARLAAVIERLLQDADRLYARAGSGIGALPPACRPGMQAARFVYAQIGQQLRRQGLDSVSRRAVVPTWRKLAWLIVAAGAGAIASRIDGSPPLAATRFLVDAAATAAPPRRQLRARGLDARVQALIRIFERLERLDRERAIGRG
jgi:phytoene synthase